MVAQRDSPSSASRGGLTGSLRTLRCMQGIVGGGLLVVAFAAVVGLALLVVLRLYRISRPSRLPGPPGEPPDG
jgi:hypothetical protein